MISVKTLHTIVLPKPFSQVARAVVHPKSTAQREEKQRTSQETTISVKGGTPAKHPAPQDQESEITLIILSYQRMRGLATLLKSLLHQDLNGLDIELILCNNSPQIRIDKSRVSNVGRLLNKFNDVKILNSHYNWRCSVRYATTHATWLERKAMEHVPRFIDRLTRKDKRSRELLSYGLHVWAHKQ